VRPARYIPALDGLRGVAIAWVVLWHTYTALGFAHPDHPLVRLVVRTGWAGVDLFFALSGFLITSLILDEVRARGDFDLPKFYLRRALRILPAFYAVLLLDLLVLRHVPLFRSAALADPTATTFTSLVTFWSNYDLQLVEPGVVAGAGYVVFWSLCVEEHFYLAWPAFLKLVRSRTTRLVVAVAVIVALPLLRAWARSSWPDEPMRVHFLSHFRLDSILAGGVAALFADELRARARAVQVAAFLAGALAAALVLRGDLSVLPPSTPLGAALGYSLLAIAASLLTCEATRPGSRAARLLSFPLLVELGKLSYGMYLVHLAVIDGVRFVLHPLLPDTTKLSVTIGLYLTFLAPSIAAAWLLRRTVELPFLRWKNRLARSQ
jgi:peptidoglycan/LPS O-acetylase OafA/YrhL